MEAEELALQKSRLVLRNRSTLSDEPRGGKFPVRGVLEAEKVSMLVRVKSAAGMVDANLGFESKLM